MLKRLLFVLALSGVTLFAQNTGGGGASYPTSNPNGKTCHGNATIQVYGGNIYTCQSGVYTIIPSSGGGSGTVTNFTAGNLSPLFTANVATSNTTPALTFSLNSQSGNLFFASPDGTSGLGSMRHILVSDLPSGYLYSNLSGAPTLYNQTIENGGTPVTQRAKLNFVGGSNVTITPTDNGTDTTTLTISSSGGGGMVYPGAGIPNSTGTAWGTSFTAPSGAIVGTTDTQTLSNKTVDGVSPTTFGYVDPTSSVQTQLNAKAPLVSPSFTTPTLGVATATSINKVAITAPASSATLTIANGKTLTANNSIAFSGTDSTTMTFPGTSQTIPGLGQANTWTSGLQDFSGVAFKPNAGSSNPGTCSVGQVFFNTSATPGQNWYFCTTTNTWTQQLNSGAGGGVTFAGTPTTTAIVTAASSSTIQTPNASATLDSSGNFSTPGSVTGASFIGSGTTPAVDILQAGTGNISALPSNSAGFAAPTTGGTSYLFKLPATASAGLLVAAAPATGDGVNESALSIMSIPASATVLSSNSSSQIVTSSIANNTALGNVSGSTGPASALTATQLTTLCNTFTSSLSGCVPASGGGTTTFLRADGTFATPGGGGNVTGPGTSVSGDIALFNNTTGTLLSDSGKVVPTGTIVGTSDTQTLTNKTVDGVSPTTFGYVDPTSSIQTQLNAKAPLVSPSFTTPTLGVATATTINKVTITAPATSATLTVANGKTLTANNSITLVGTDSTTMTFPSSSATITQTIASGTATLGTSAIASGACATVVTATATGTATTDVISTSFNGDPTAVTGYGVSATGAVLTIYPYPTANTANFKVCNSTASSITPGALTLNWRVTR